VIKVFTW